MRRTYQLAALAVALIVGASSATAAAPERARSPSSVTSLSVVPAAGRAEVVVVVDGAVDVIDFTLESPRRIVVDFRGATLNAPVRFYDKVSRAGIVNVRVAQYKPNVVRLVLDLDGPREYSVVRGEKDVRIAVSGPDQFVAWHLGDAGKTAASAIAVPAEARASAAAPAVPEPMLLLQKVPANDKPRITWTNDAGKATIRDVAADFATFANVTIVVGSSVTDLKIPFLQIKDKPWDVAFAAILSSLNLTAVEDSSGIITVDSYQNIAARQSSEPLVSQIVPVNYAKAATLAKTITDLLSAGCNKGGAPAGGTGGGGASAAAVAGGAGAGGGAVDAGGAAGGASGISAAGCGRGSVATDDKTNSLIITETQARLSDVMGFIKDLDVRTPLVAIKAKIIAVDRTGTEKLGLSYNFGSSNAGQSGSNPVNLTGDSFSGIANATRQYQAEATVSLIYKMAIGGFNLTSFLDALSQEQLTDIQAEPSTTTLDNSEATLFSGSKISFLLTPPIPAGQLTSVAPQISQQEIGITLKVTPRVTANRMLNLIIDATQEQLVDVSAAGPNTNKRQSHNEVLVADGETAVIGGLTQTQVTRNKSGIPILSQLPIIGRLFSQTSTIERKQDLLILITPHILDDGDVVKGGVRPAAEKKP
jgi:type IV pilus assembly protein PilQ